MKPLKLRCHYSVAIMEFVKMVVAVVILAGSQLENLLTQGADSLEKVERQVGGGQRIVWLVFALIAAVVIYFLFRLHAWRKTYIIVTDQNFIYDKRTYFLQKQVKFKLSQIASVNLKKGVLDYIFGTYTISLDINSLATANKTDFRLVFSERVARSFEAAVKAGRLNETPATGDAVQTKAGETVAWPLLQFSIGQIMRHSALSTSPVLVLTLVGAILGIAVPLINVSGFLYPLVVALGLPAALIFSVLISMVHSLFSYYGFTVEKSERELYVSYGLITKRTSCLPLSKTNGIIARQTLFGRLFRMYYLEILNVGVGTDDKAGAPLFTLMMNREQTERIIRTVAPEFDGALDTVHSPQAGLCPVFIKGLFTFVGFAAAVSLFGLLWNNTVLTTSIIVTLFCLTLLLCLLSFKAKGIQAGKEILTVATGIVNRRVIMVPYVRVQMLRVRRGPVSQALRLRCGSLFVLSNLVNQENHIGYFKSDVFHAVQQRMEQHGTATWIQTGKEG